MAASAAGSIEGFSSCYYRVHYFVLQGLTHQAVKWVRLTKDVPRLPGAAGIYMVVAYQPDNWFQPNGSPCYWLP